MSQSGFQWQPNGWPTLEQSRQLGRNGMKWLKALAIGAFVIGTVSSAQGPSLVPQLKPAGPVASGTPIAPAPAAGAMTKQDVDTWLEGFMPYAIARGDIAGAVVVVVKDGQILTQKGFGFSNVEKRTQVSPETTLFRPGSVSKLFTWTAVMQLVEQGKIDLDKDVNAYLDFKIPPRDGKPITMRNIMTHTAGFEETVRHLIHDDRAPAYPLEPIRQGQPAEPGLCPGNDARLFQLCDGGRRLHCAAPIGNAVRRLYRQEYLRSAWHDPFEFSPAASQGAPALHVRRLFGRIAEGREIRICRSCPGGQPVGNGRGHGQVHDCPPQ